MVGEMRDKETTAIGIEASLTGHLVFATLHTNSAPESIIRLLDMGMDPFNFADALLGILAQRLAKRLCKCKEPHIADARRRSRRCWTEYCQRAGEHRHLEEGPEGGATRAFTSEWVKNFGNDKGQFTLYTPVGCDAAAAPATRAASACTSC